jgi:hypothetical protein
MSMSTFALLIALPVARRCSFSGERFAFARSSVR